jgi:hypothetical protein
MLAIDLSAAKHDPTLTWRSPYASPRYGDCMTYIERWETLEALSQ